MSNIDTSCHSYPNTCFDSNAIDHCTGYADTNASSELWNHLCNEQ
jgi:hypothetical protein